MADHKNIHEAVLAVYQGGKLYAQKASRNDVQSYNYVSEADFLALLRPQLAEHDITCFPQHSVISEGTFTTAKGTVMQRITIGGDFSFIHAPSQTSIVVRTIGQGTDQQDKAAYKAMTGALKYAVRQLFLVETGDDPEEPKTDESPQAPPPSKFMLALTEQKERLAEGNPKGYQKVIAELVPEGTHDLDSLPVETKKLIIATLKQVPPF